MAAVEANSLKQTSKHKNTDLALLNRSRVLEVLRQLKPVLSEKYGVTQLGFFGSVARGQATAESDVDIVMEIAQPSLFVSVHVKADLEEALLIPVDLVRYRQRMNAYLKRTIEQEAIFE